MFAYKRALTNVAVPAYNIPGVALAEAKDRAQELAVEIRKGRDPVHDKRDG
jgi:hypothetical protein